MRFCKGNDFFLCFEEVKINVEIERTFILSYSQGYCEEDFEILEIYDKFGLKILEFINLFNSRFDLFANFGLVLCLLTEKLSNFIDEC